MSFPHEHHYLLEDHRIISNAKKSSWVFLLTALMMFVEIAAGYLTHSMSLLADGWHMASHSAAMFISLLAYRLGRSKKLSETLSFGAGKFIPLGGYTSALILAMIAILMAIESVQRLFRSETIQFNEAIGIAVVGLLVNLVSAWILHSEDSHHEEHAHTHHEEAHGHDHHHHDHNLRSAYVHVLADAFTSVLAIVALILGKYFGLNWLDSLMGIVGAGVILKWAYNLCRETGSELLDVHSKQLPPEKVRSFLERNDMKVLDLHTWRIAPSAIACEIVVESSKLRGGDFYRSQILSQFDFDHLIVEERLATK